jgi:hypothetical protein
VNEELDDAAVTAAVAGYPRTGRDLADGYLLAALTIRATYDPDDPEISRALRLYVGGPARLRDLDAAIRLVGRLMREEARRQEGGGVLAAVADQADAALADAAMTVVMPAVPRVPGEDTQEIRVPVGPPPHEFLAPWGGQGGCGWLWEPRGRDAGPDHCGLPYEHPAHNFPARPL